MTFDSVVLNRLIKRVTEAAVENGRHLTNGNAIDFADYSNRVGYLRALEDVLAWMRETESALNRGE